jgi:hypothetical protein
MAEQRKQAPKV